MYLESVYSYRGLRRGRVPALPIRPDIAVRRTGAVAERRKHALEQFLRKLLENPLYRKHEETVGSVIFIRSLICRNASQSFMNYV
jgi:plasmid stabilization system protein ParE